MTVIAQSLVVLYPLAEKALFCVPHTRVKPDGVIVIELKEGVRGKMEQIFQQNVNEIEKVINIRTKDYIQMRILDRILRDVPHFVSLTNWSLDFGKWVDARCTIRSRSFFIDFTTSYKEFHKKMERLKNRNDPIDENSAPKIIMYFDGNAVERIFSLCEDYPEGMDDAIELFFSEEKQRWISVAFQRNQKFQDRIDVLGEQCRKYGKYECFMI